MIIELADAVLGARLVENGVAARAQQGERVASTLGTRIEDDDDGDEENSIQRVAGRQREQGIDRQHRVFVSRKRSNGPAGLVDAIDGLGLAET